MGGSEIRSHDHVSNHSTKQKQTGGDLANGLWETQYRTSAAGFQKPSDNRASLYPHDNTVSSLAG